MRAGFASASQRHMSRSKAAPVGKRRHARRKEDAHLEELARQLRTFLAYAAQHPLRRFSKGTQTLIIEATPIIAQLDHLRRERRPAQASSAKL